MAHPLIDQIFRIVKIAHWSSRTTTNGYQDRFPIGKMWDAHCHRLCSRLSVMTPTRASRFLTIVGSVASFVSPFGFFDPLARIEMK
jgi:hypothetical protein